MLILRSIALLGLIVIFNSKEESHGYKREKLDWLICTEPLTVIGQTGVSWSLASLQSEIKDLKLLD